MRCDFHLHTHHSDGTIPPKALAAALRTAGVTHFAVTDHDTVLGWRALRGTPGLIPGVELTTQLDGREIHLVALGIDPEQTAFTQFLSAIRSTRILRLTALIARLPEPIRGTLSIDALHDGNAEALGRLHLAKALVAARAVPTINAAFDEYIGDEYAVDAGLPPYPTPEAGCAAIHSAGGVAILAHPGLYGTLAAAERLFDLGCDGLEVSHPNLDPGLAADLIGFAKRRHALMSCGSDLHFLGARKPGDWSLPADLLRPLCDRLGL